MVAIDGEFLSSLEETTSGLDIILEEHDLALANDGELLLGVFNTGLHEQVVCRLDSFGSDRTVAGDSALV